MNKDIVAFDENILTKTRESTSLQRCSEIDALRGLAIVIMTLDHVRDFAGNTIIDATDPATSNLPLFFTRFITHICAPIFMLMAGVGARLSLGKYSRSEVREFLVKRGLWLIFLEVTIVSQGWAFGTKIICLQTIWALGVSMMVLGGLLVLPDILIGSLGVLILFTHNAFDGIKGAQLGKFGFLWDIFHNCPEFFIGKYTVQVLYPPLPWIGVLCVGWAFAHFFILEKQSRDKIMMSTASLMLLLFLALRFTHGYGDPYSRMFEINFSNIQQTIMRFLVVTKYPPSLQYLLITFSLSLFAYTFINKIISSSRNPLVVFGKVPFFFYILHLYWAHLIGMGLFWLKKGFVNFTWDSSHEQDLINSSLPLIYLIWIFVVISLYPACVWFANIKASHKKWWLRYL